MRKNNRTVRLDRVNSSIYYLLKIPEFIRDISIKKVPGKVESVQILGGHKVHLPDSSRDGYNITLVYHTNNSTYTKEFIDITEKSKDELERLFLES